MSLRFPRVTEYVYQEYLHAWLALGRLWTPVGNLLPVCAVCGWAIPKANSYQAHHLYLSQGYAKSDLRNLCPVHDQDYNSCHEQGAHGGDQVHFQRHFYVMGSGDAHHGREIVLSAAIELWVERTRVEVPEVIEGLNLWV